MPPTMPRPWPIRRGCTALFALVLAVVRPAAADDAAGDFNVLLNSANQSWSCAGGATLLGAFTLLPSSTTDGFGRRGWRVAATNERVMKNVNAVPVNLGGGLIVPAGGLTLEPGATGFVSARWRASRAGAATIVARFLRHSPNSMEPAQVAIRHGSALVYSGWLVRDATPVLSAAVTLAVSAGDVVDFIAGSGDGSSAGDVIGLQATVHIEPVPLASGPVISFAGERFVACRGDTAFESMAFDPLNRRSVSNGIVRDLCGRAVFEGPEDSPGMTWDPRTQTYWTINNARLIRQWAANGVLIGNVLTLPQVFTVPGWGPDTLDNVKGIAVDSNFVYVVDSGPAGEEGQIRSNEWFKFTRAGAPVKSSKLTDFHANLDLDPDCVVDDIVYVPFSNPYLRGRLIIPLEHSGMQVIDTEGNFVSRFRWSQPGVPEDVRLAGFAGITLDPLTGNLYLVENSGATMQIWTRLPEPGPTYYAVGTGGGVPRLHLPATGCNRPLWQALPPEAGLVFGCAYRTANQTIYGMDFASSELYRAHAASGVGGRVVLTGAFGSWACAYDTERDVLYGAVEINGGTRLVAVDPVTGAVDPRPGTIGFNVTDLAFHPNDRRLYGSDGAQLIRIDRDTGAGTIVGPTVGVQGIDFDPASNRLIGIQNSGPSGSATMWSIDPATGAGTTIAHVPLNTAWEGLAVVPVAAAGVLGSTPADPGALVALVAGPNPTRGPVRLRFTLPSAARVSAGVYDVQGRKVRDLDVGARPAGLHVVDWNGRDDMGTQVAGGVYFARIEHGGRALVARIVRVE